MSTFDPEAFQRAVDAHTAALEQFGEDDPRSIEAGLLALSLAPDELFNEVQEIAQATLQ